MRSFWICVLFGLFPSSQGQPRQSTSRIVDMGTLNYGQAKFFSRTERWALYATRALGKTNDGGATWTAIVPPDVKDDATRDIDRAYFESASAAWVVTAPTPKPLLDEGRRLFRTLDAGRTWAEQDLPRTRWTEDSFFADVNSGSSGLAGRSIMCLRRYQLVSNAHRGFGGCLRYQSFSTREASSPHRLSNPFRRKTLSSHDNSICERTAWGRSFTKLNLLHRHAGQPGAKAK